MAKLIKTDLSIILLRFSNFKRIYHQTRKSKYHKKNYEAVCGGDLALPKSSTFLFFAIFIFLIFTISIYLLFLKNLKDNHTKNQEIAFYKIQKETNNLLSKLLYNFENKKESVLEKHKEVLEYLENSSYEINLDEIHKKINKDLPNKPYNIYITDENFIIKNTTYLADLDFDLSFAKKTFLEHKQKNETGISQPIFEFYSSKFFTYTDSFLPNSNRVLQLSYTYDKLNKDIEFLKNLLENSLDIKSSDAFVVYPDGFIGEFIFKQGDIKNIDERAKEAKILVESLDENRYSTKNKEDKSKKLTYLSERSPIFDDINIIYTIIFDETSLQKNIFLLNLIIFILTLIGLVTIFIIYKVRKKELILNYKDKFIEHSIHEIKTPLSIITLNIQLRNKIFGDDKYSKKIDGALKTLKNSYEDMTFLQTKSYIDYKIERLDLAEILKNRVKYFNIIAQTQNRELEIEILESCDVFMSEIELTRLIDNNLSNAIKYSFSNSVIKISLENSTLYFFSFGTNIIDDKAIFNRYSRENISSGGFGIGLSIVKDICTKYKIDISVDSQNNINTFSYRFNCHKFDTNNI